MSTPTASESETMRAEFEEFARKRWGNAPWTTRRKGDGYISEDSDQGWAVWQAAWSRAPSAEAKDAEMLPDRLDRLADELVAADTAHDSFMPGLASSIKGRALLLRHVYGPTGRPPAIAQQGAAAAQEVGHG